MTCFVKTRKFRPWDEMAAVVLVASSHGKLNYKDEKKTNVLNVTGCELFHNHQ